MFLFFVFHLLNKMKGVDVPKMTQNAFPPSKEKKNEIVIKKKK